MGFVLKMEKRKEGIVPWVAPEWGAFLHRCRDACRSAFGNVAAYKEDAKHKSL
jgi:hypothetical protein